MEPWGKKGIIGGGCDFSKAYRIYFSGQKQAEIRRNVTIDEDVACKLSKKSNIGNVEENFEHPQDVVMADLKPS